MKSKWNIFKLALKMVFSKKSKNFLLFICLMIVTALPYIVYTVSDSMYNSVVEQNNNVYGIFSDVYYDENMQMTTDLELSEDLLRMEFEGYYFQQAGAMFIVKQWNTVDDKIAAMGYADDIAINLGCINLVSGHMPKKNNEVAVTESMVEQLSAGSKIGDEIKIAGEIYIISGIVKDYGRLWPSGEMQEQVSTINIFITKTKAENIREGEAGYKRIILFERQHNLTGNYQNQEYFYDNVNAWSNSTDSVFTVPDLFVGIVYICVCLVVINILYLSRDSVQSNMNVLFVLGMDKNDRDFFLICHYMIINSLSVLCGWLVGWRCSLYIIEALSMEMKTNLFYYGNSSSFIVLLVFIIANIGSSIFIVSMNSSKIKKYNCKNRSPKRFTLRRMAFAEFSTLGGRLIAIILLLTMLIVLILFGILYKNRFMQETTHIEVAGKMPYDYDYQMYITTRNSMPGDENTALFYNAVEKDMITKDTVEKIKSIEGVNEIKVYKTDIQSQLLMNKSIEIDKYLDVMDFWEDGRYKPWSGFNPVGYEIFGYNDNLVIPVTIMGYSADEILLYEDFNVDGVIDIDKINAGEEVVLIVPPVRLEINEAGGIKKNWVNINTDGAYINEMLHVGDEIVLSRLISNDVINGAVTKEDAANVLTRLDVTVRIGAIIYDHVGWFGKELDNDEAYDIMVTNEFFNAHSYEDVYSIIRIYTDNDADYTYINAELHDILADYPYVMLEDYRLEVSSFKSMNFMIKLFVTIMIILVITTAFLCIISQMFIQLRFNRKKYMLLRVNGLTRTKLSLIWIIQYAILTVIGIILSAPILLLLSNKLLYIPMESFMNYISVQEIIFAITTTIAIVAISLLALIIKYRKENICEAIRE